MKPIGPTALLTIYVHITNVKTETQTLSLDRLVRITSSNALLKSVYMRTVFEFFLKHLITKDVNIGKFGVVELCLMNPC